MSDSVMRGRERGGEENRKISEMIVSAWKIPTADCRS